MTEIISAISSVGFPIVMCLLMYSQNKDTIKTITENNRATMESLNENTQAITKLSDKLEVFFNTNK